MRRHVNPTTPARTALAPYNFVPLPQRVLLADAAAKNASVAQDRFLTRDAETGAEWFSGWIDLEIVSLTPVFVRGAATTDERGQWDAREARLRPDSYTTREGKPALPGSSLRGMIRTLVEILASGKLTPVTDERPFFRTVAADRIGDRYRSLLVRGEGGHRGGFARRLPNGAWQIDPVAEVLRVEHDLLRGLGLEYRQHPNYHPTWDLQQKPCWITRGDRRYRVAKLALGEARPAGDAWERGTLVLSGSAPRKKKEFVFVGQGGDPIDIPSEILDRFHSDDQLTQWQELAFPRNEPALGSRRAKGQLRDGEPVFFVCGDTQTLEFFGRAGMFRFPYDTNPAELLSDEHRADSLDVAEALFGRVPRQGRRPSGEDKAIRGRVRVEDAVASGEAPGRGWFEAPMVPAILASPKVTAFQHYLTQNGDADARSLTTYIAGDGTTLRGHKLYWHRWGDRGLDEARHRDQAQKLQDLRGVTPKDTQCTIIRPVRADVRYAGKMHFDNLTAFELGALLSALRLPSGCAHKVGMAKPLGLGSVKVSARLSLVQPSRRYAGWADAGVVEGERGERFERAFADGMIRHAQACGEAMIAGKEGLASIARIDALYALLAWEGRPPVQSTRTMSIEGGDASRFRADSRGKVNEFRDRPVLPTPHAVAGRPEPAWPGEKPMPSRDVALSESSRRSPAAQVLLEKLSTPRTAPAKPIPVPPTKPPGPAVGTRVRVEVLAEKTKKGGLMFQIIGTNQKGVMHPQSAAPPDASPGARLELVVMAGGAMFQFKYVAG